MKIFLDTNVVIDVFAQREPFYAWSALVWSLVESGKVRGYLSAISFNNVYYIVRHIAGKKRAMGAIRLLHQVFETVSVTDQIIAQAIDADLDDFEDAIQYHCALQSRSAYWVTRNPKDFPDGGPTIVSPDEFLSIVNNEGHSKG
ncbi:MAG TPA: PIN domain-containing protein [Candidatus Hydrogenedentes bacterium]|nr:PIN domain-containing protein [Candidatus Hydrogenedentota bacterium]